MSHKQAKIYAKFVYHNSKYSSLNPPLKPRNELRLYLNNSLDDNKNLFRVDDILVIEKILIESSSIDETQIPCVYSMSLFNRANYNEYEILEQIISESNLKGGHAIYNRKLDFVDLPSFEAIQNADITQDIITVVKEEQQELIDKIDRVEDEVTIEEIRGANLFNSVSFRDFVLMAYSSRCAITGVSISHKSLINLEAAHIQPKAHSGTFLPCNGLALSRDMHWAFDKGFFTISDDYKVIVHENVRSTFLSEYDGKYIRIPADEFFRPEKKFLKHHRDNVFGLFMNSGVIRSL